MRSSPTPRLACGILAGGRGSRYDGSPKGLLEVSEGSRILDRLLAAVRSAGFGDVVLSANDSLPYREYALKTVADRRPDRGPLAGIEALLHHLQPTYEAVLVLPCDLPGITRHELLVLREAYLQGRGPLLVAQIGDALQPLCAIVSVGLAGAISRALDQGEDRVGRLWHKLGAVGIPFADPRPFFNINTPEDLARWRSLEAGADPKSISSGNDEDLS
ncbi:MAG: molybdenum cofactor guanylyltransferase [Planctomycetota bacterium]